MRIPKSWVPGLAKKIIDSLFEKKMIELNKVTKDELIKLTDHLILDELSVEEGINREVKELLRKYDSEIEKGRMDYHKLFELTKRKLVKERNIIL